MAPDFERLITPSCKNAPTLKINDKVYNGDICHIKKVGQSRLIFARVRVFAREMWTGKSDLVLTAR